MPACVPACVRGRARVCACLRACMFMYVYVSVYLFIHTCLYICTYTYIDILMHTMLVLESESAELPQNSRRSDRPMSSNLNIPKERKRTSESLLELQ